MRKQLLLSLTLSLLLLGMGTLPAHAQAPPITYQRYDTAITLQPNGNFIVREIQEIRFDDEFRTAFADIPTALVTDIQNIQLYEEETPYDEGGSGPGTFTTETDTDFIYVNWEYTPTEPGDVRTFVLEYEVVGGLWVYPNEKVLEWRAVPADRSGIEVEQSTVTVTLPTAVATDQLHYTAYGPTFQATATATTVTFVATEALPDGVQFQIQVGLPGDLINGARQPWQIQEDSAALKYRFTNLDVALTLQPDGALLVDEAHHLVVEAGALDQGYRQIPLNFLDTIDQIRVTEGEQTFSEAATNCTYCLQILQTPRAAGWARYDRTQQAVVTDASRAGSVELNWQFPPLVRGEETTLRLRYRVLGAVRHLADQQRINWTAVFPERDQAVAAARVTLQLPAGVERTNVEVAGGTVEWLDEKTVLISAPGPIQPADAWDIQLTLPATATQSSVPQWQLALEDAAIEARQAAVLQARLQLGFGAAAILVLLLGLLGVFLIWYLLGRDKPLPAIADYLTEPPSNLPPAIVAYLTDEEPSVQGALASLFHLAQVGLIWIRLDGSLAIKRVREEKLVAGETVTTTTGETVALPEHLVTLFNALQPVLPYQEEVPLHQIYAQFQAILPLVYAQMGNETNHFFDESPTQARHRWSVRGQWLVLLGVIFAVGLALRFFNELGWLAIAPGVAAALAGFALIFASQWMPRRTTAGVEETQRWLAFRTYLRNLQQYGDVNQAQRILDRYFAYAVALDVEQVVLEQAADLGGAMPDWSYTPSWEPLRRSYPRRSQPSTPSSAGLPPLSTPPFGGQTATAPAPSGERPSLSGMSKHLGSSLTNASQNLGSLLRTAANDDGQNTPFESLWAGTQTAGRVGGKVASTTLDIIGTILEESSSGGGGGGYSSSGSSRSSWSSSSSRSSSSSSSRSSSSAGRSSSSRRSGGGGKRGFG